MVGTCRANTIDVEGTLAGVNWQAGGAWIELQTRAIHVLDGGVLEIGTEATPYLADCNITLIGSATDPGIEGQGSGDISGTDLIQFQPLNGLYDI